MEEWGFHVQRHQTLNLYMREYRGRRDGSGLKSPGCSSRVIPVWLLGPIVGGS